MPPALKIVLLIYYSFECLWVLIIEKDLYYLGKFNDLLTYKSLRYLFFFCSDLEL